MTCSWQYPSISVGNSGLSILPETCQVAPFCSFNLFSPWVEVRWQLGVKLELCGGQSCCVLRAIVHVSNHTLSPQWECKYLKLRASSQCHGSWNYGMFGQKWLQWLANVSQAAGRGGEAHRVQAFLELQHDILKGDSGSPSRSCGFVSLLTFCCAHAPINSEKKIVLNLFHVICGNLKYVSEDSLWLLNVCYPDGMSLTGRNAARGLGWCCLSGSALGKTALQGESVHEAESKPGPPSRFSILSLVTMTTLSCQCLVNCLSEAWWRVKCSQLVRSKAPPTINSEHLSLLCQWSPSGCLTNWPGSLPVWLPRSHWDSVLWEADDNWWIFRRYAFWEGLSGIKGSVL